MSSSVRLYRVIQPVRDISLAQEFYCAVLGFEGERISPGRHYFDCGGTILACYDPVADGDGAGGSWRHHPKQYLYLSTGNLGEVFDSVQKAGGTIEAKIETMPWGERLFYAKDPFGNPICFVDANTLFSGHRARPS